MRDAIVVLASGQYILLHALTLSTSLALLFEVV